MAAADDRPLAGLRVLVTRPQPQAQRLAQHLQQAGAEPYCFPALEIAAVRADAALARVLDDAARFDLAIFISPNAVTHGLAALAERPRPPRVAAIGRGTAAALTEAGIVDVLIPADGADSESLLALPALRQLAGKRVLIFRGVGGRELLAETLRARGAEVTLAECYRRVRPTSDTAPLTTRLRSGTLDVVTVTSVETLHNLHAMLDDEARVRLRRLPIMVVGARQAEACRALGHAGTPIIAHDAGDDALLAALKAWRARQNPL